MDENESGWDANVPGNHISSEDKTRKDSAISPLALQSDTAYNVKFNHDAKIVLNLVHALTVNDTDRIYAAFNMDGNHLATVSEAGIVNIFDVKTGKRLW